MRAVPQPGAVILRTFIPGNPKTKGSLKPYPTRKRNGTVICILKEQVIGSENWKNVMIEHFSAIIQDPTKFDRSLLCPFDGACELEARFMLPRPPSVKTKYPTSQFDGDLDKLMRNLGDALEQSGVLNNDARLVDETIIKRFADNCNPGIFVTVKVKSEDRDDSEEDMRTYVSRLWAKDWVEGA